MPDGLQALVAQVEALVDRVQSEPRRCREFRIYRHTDAAGRLPGEILAVGVVLPSGRCVLEFCAAPDLMERHQDLVELMAVHGRDGRTEVVFLDGEF